MDRVCVQNSDDEHKEDVNDSRGEGHDTTCDLYETGSEGHDITCEGRSSISAEDTLEKRKLSHKKWRALLKKQKRKAKRQAEARLIEASKEAEPPPLPGEELWEKQQQNIKEQYQEKLRLALHQKWLEREERACEEFKNELLREKLEKERRLQEEERIRVEWEERQQREKEEEEVKKKEQEERLKKATKSREDNGSGPWHNPLAPPSQPEDNLPPCPFFSKVGACRFGNKCSRAHHYPEESTTILLPAMYTHFKLDHSVLNEFDHDLGLEYEEHETYQHFLEFYQDTVPEFEKYGRIVEFKVCANYEPHLRGNVYVQYEKPEQAARACAALHCRWYAGKQLTCQLTVVETWRQAVCGLFYNKKCPKGRTCNFLHAFRNPSRRFRRSYRDVSPHRKRRDERHRRYSRSRSRSYSPDRSRRRQHKRQRSCSRSPYYRKEKLRSRSRSPYYERSLSRSPDIQRSRYRSRLKEQSTRSQERSERISRESLSRRSRDRSKERVRNRSRAKERIRHRSRSKERTRDRSRSKERTRDRSRSKERTRDRSRSKERTRDRSRSKERTRDRSRSKERTRDRSRSKERARDRSRSKERARDRSRSKERARDRSRSKERTRDRSRSKERARDRSRSKDRVRDKSMSKKRSRSKEMLRISVDEPLVSRDKKCELNTERKRKIKKKSKKSHRKSSPTKEIHDGTNEINNSSPNGESKWDSVKSPNSTNWDFRNNGSTPLKYITDGDSPTHRAPPTRSVQELISSYPETQVKDDNIVNQTNNKDKALEFLDNVIADLGTSSKRS